MKKTMFPREFVEWLIHNTMEATNYSPMLYLRKGVTVYYQKEYHLDDMYEYWRLKIEPKILREREAALKKLFIRKEDETD